MLLPFREHLDFGPTPYDQLQAKDGIPVVRGNVVSDVLELELGRWERMGVAGCYLNLAEQQQTDPTCVKFRRGAKSCPSAIFMKRSSMLPKDAAPLRYGRKGSLKLLSNGEPARCLPSRCILLISTSTALGTNPSVCLPEPLARA